MAASGLSNSNYSAIMLKMDNMWKDSQVNSDYIGYVDAMKAIKAEQTAVLDSVQGNKSLTMSLTWMNNTGLTTAAVTDICTMTGTETTIAKKDITIASKRKVGFKISDTELRTSIFNVEDLVAKNLMQASKTMDEYLASQAVTFVEASKSTVNDYAPVGTTTAAPATSNTAGVVTIAPARFNINLLGFFTLSGIRNKMASPYILSGTNLWTDWWNAMQNAANGEGKGNDNMFKSFRKYFDVFNVETVAAGCTYLIDKGAIAFGNQHFYDMRPVDYGNVGQRWSMQSFNIPGVWYDVHYRIDCTSNEIVHSYELHCYWDFFLNPLGATSTRKGVLKFVNA
jgi:hypothetical protein